MGPGRGTQICVSGPLVPASAAPHVGEELEGDLGVPPGTTFSDGGLVVLALAEMSPPGWDAPVVTHMVSGTVEAEGQRFMGHRKGLFSQGGCGNVG